MKDNVFYEELTLLENLMFYSRIKNENENNF